jgi:hypothetical protein
MSAVRLGEKNIDMTNAASTMRQETAKPTWVRMLLPATHHQPVTNVSGWASRRRASAVLEYPL